MTIIQVTYCVGFKELEYHFSLNPYVSNRHRTTELTPTYCGYIFDTYENFPDTLFFKGKRIL